MNSRPTLLLTLLLVGSALARPALGQEYDDPTRVARWKPFVLAAADAIPVPAPPADDSERAKLDLAELHLLQTLRSPFLNQAIRVWNNGPATRRWTEIGAGLARDERLNNNRNIRAMAILHTAMYDAVIAAYHAKYQYNRKAPALVATDLTTTTGMTDVPSYPSEHAAIAGAAAGVLSALFPKSAAALAAQALEAAQARMVAGASYRSDVEAGLALGAEVAKQANARAAADGSDAKWTGTVPKGPGYWIGENPIEPLMGTWTPWFLLSGSQVRPPPPPAFGSPRFLAELAEVKRINQSITPSERAVATLWAGIAPTIMADTAYALITAHGLDTPHAARVMALSYAAQIDAFIAAHDAKFTYWQIRPAQADPTIVPVITDPPHPSYVSNGAATWTTAAEVLAYFFPGDAPRLRLIADEGARSRMLGGIHYRSDLEAGQQIARRVVTHAIERDQLNEN